MSVEKEECSPTLATTPDPSKNQGGTCICYENHAQDSRVKELSQGVSPQLNAKAGTGGNNLPLVQTFQKVSRPHGKDGLGERWAESECAATQNIFDQGDARAVDVCVPINSMVIGKELKDGDRQTVGIGMQSEHHHAVAVCSHSFEPGILKRENGNESRLNKEISGTLRSNMGDNQESVAIAENIIGRKVENGENGVGAQNELAYTQNATGVMGVSCNATVRRLLPVECERLMGFPDGHTRIKWKGKSAEECPDAPRYKACGNSMCVNVMRWIGMRIELVERKAR